MKNRTKFWLSGSYPSQSPQVILFMSSFTWAEAGSEAAPNTATAMTRIFLFMAILRCAKRSLHACRIFQARHDGFSRVILAPGFHVLDVLLMRDKVHHCLAELVTEPAAHPGREVTRLGGSHGEILLASDVGHLDGQLRIGSHRNNPDRERQAHWSESHR